MAKPRKPVREINWSPLLHDHRPWQSRHHDAQSELVAYCEASGAWEVTAILFPTPGASAVEMANFIGRLVNNAQRTQELLQSAVDALEMCLEEGKLSAVAEQQADSTVTRIRKLIL